MKTKISILPYDQSQDCLDLVRMLMGMYFNFASSNGLSVSLEERIGGVVSLVISGDKIPDLTVEHGIHRLVRMSPYDPLKRRHTNFCQVSAGKGEGLRDVIRSYVFHPYELAKDLRTGKSTEDVELVLSGRPDLLW